MRLGMKWYGEKSTPSVIQLKQNPLTSKADQEVQLSFSSVVKSLRHLRTAFRRPGSYLPDGSQMNEMKFILLAEWKQGNGRENTRKTQKITILYMT